MDLPAGSMGPKVQAACDFARNTGNEAVIGSLADITEDRRRQCGDAGAHQVAKQSVSKRRPVVETGDEQSKTGAVGTKPKSRTVLGPWASEDQRHSAKGPTALTARAVSHVAST